MLSVDFIIRRNYGYLILPKKKFNEIEAFFIFEAGLQQIYSVIVSKFELYMNLLLRN